MSRRCVPILLFALVGLLVGLFPENKSALVAIRRGDALAGQLRYSAALDAYAAAARACPGCPQPLLRQGDVYTRQRRYGEAWTVYLAAMDVGGHSDQVSEALARLYLAQGEPGWAMQAWQRLLARRPQRADGWMQLAEAHLAAADEEKARRAFERALGLPLSDRDRQIVHDRLGVLCSESDLIGALAHFKEVMRGPDPALSKQAEALVAALQMVNQGNVPALGRAKLGQAWLEHGDLALARQQLEMAIGLEPTYVDAHAYLGYVCSLLGDNQAATLHLGQAIVLDPTYPLPHYFLGMHHIRRGWWFTAREVLAHAHDLDPTNPAICAAMADTYIRGPEPAYALAERWLHAAVDYAPEDVRFHLLLAHFYVDVGVDPGLRGVSVAQFAVNLAPQNAEALETLGWAYYLSGRADLALEPLIRASGLAPMEPRIYYRLGEVYRALGRGDRASELYQTALDLDWQGPVGDQARRALQNP